MRIHEEVRMGSLVQRLGEVLAEGKNKPHPE